MIKVKIDDLWKVLGHKYDDGIESNKIGKRDIYMRPPKIRFGTTFWPGGA